MLCTCFDAPSMQPRTVDSDSEGERIYNVPKAIVSVGSASLFYSPKGCKMV
jgi:hypothetical protein